MPSSVTESAIVADPWRKGASASSRRAHTTVSCSPLWAILSAIGVPWLPSPIKPTRTSAQVIW